MLIMSLTAHVVAIRPAALVGFPVMIITATTLILVLLYLVGPEAEGAVTDPVRAALASAFIPAIAVDPQTGRILAANDQAVELFGSTRPSAGNHLSDLFSSDNPEECPRIFRTAVECGHAEVPACSMRTDTGDPVIVELLARLHVVGESSFVIVGFAVNEANQAIAQFARVQERLMSNISHELRTPLNVVMGFSELLTTGTLGEMPENQLDAAQECHEGGERILRLINDILDVGRSRSYYLTGDTQQFSPLEMIGRIQNLLAGQARRENLYMEVNLEPDVPVVDCEERPFKQLIYHLILNSMDRSEPGGVVRLAAYREGDDLVFRVSDSGPGVTELTRPRPAQPVSEEEARETLAPPLVGLPLCLALAERLGASLVTTTDQEGVHFTVRMPLSRS